MEVRGNEVVGELPVPACPYKVFLGWYDENDTEYTADTVYSLDRDITLTAKWRNFMYNVQYKANRPNEATSPIVGNMNNSVHQYYVAANLSKNLFNIEGWRFTGWNTKEDGTGTPYSDQAAFLNLCKEDNGVITLYAQWERIDYYVKYEKNLPSAVTGSYRVEGTMPDLRLNYDRKFNLAINAYTLKGWEFEGWSLTSDGSAGIIPDCGSVLNLTEKQGVVVSLYAQWRIVNYDVYIDYSNSGIKEFYRTYNIETPTFNIIAKEKYGYETILTTERILQYSIGDIEVKATYKIQNYSIEYLLNGGNNNVLNPDKFNVIDHVELQAPTREGYRFIGWKCNGQYITNLDGLTGNLIIEAVWEPITQLQVTDTNVLLVNENSYVVLPNAQFNSSCKISVSSSVRTLTITSNVNLQFSLYIEIRERGSDFDITLNNVKFKAPNDCEAISMVSQYTLNLQTTGMCEIRGGDGSAGNKDFMLTNAMDAKIALIGGVGSYGRNAINCYKLVVNASNINIYGGNGGRGDDGFNGDNTVRGTGFSGGRGSNAIKVTVSVTFIGNNITVVGGNGGNGGSKSIPDGSTEAANPGGKGGTGASAILGTVIGSADIKKGFDGRDGHYGPIIMF